MPLLYQQNINERVKWALWQIQEPLEFFISDGYEANHIGHPEKRIQHLAGRFLLKSLLPELKLSDVMVSDNRKPIILHQPNIDFSVSHSNDLVGVLIGKDHNVGMDIELLRPKVVSVKHKFMSEEDEFAFPSDEFSEVDIATICWTLKESAYKLMGKPGVDFKRDLSIKKVSTDNKGWTAVMKYAGLPDLEISAKGQIINNSHICIMAQKK